MVLALPSLQVQPLGARSMLEVTLSSSGVVVAPGPEPLLFTGVSEMALTRPPLI
jgi:hypothetical protein